MVIWNPEKRRWGCVIPTFLTDKEVEILEYAINAYMFVMNGKAKFSFGELADEIEKHFDLKEPRNWEVVRVLRKANLCNPT